MKYLILITLFLLGCAPPTTPDDPKFNFGDEVSFKTPFFGFCIATLERSPVYYNDSWVYPVTNYKCGAKVGNEKLFFREKDLNF